MAGGYLSAWKKPKTLAVLGFFVRRITTCVWTQWRRAYTSSFILS